VNINDKPSTGARIAETDKKKGPFAQFGRLAMIYDVGDVWKE
jgi:hypothetical protein